VVEIIKSWEEKNKMDKQSVSMVILAFLTLIIGVSLLVTASGEIANVAQTVNVQNETLDISDAVELTGAGVGFYNFSFANLTGDGTTTSEFDEASGCVTAISNASGAAAGSYLTVTTDYIAYCNPTTAGQGRGVFHFTNTTKVQNFANVSTANLTNISYRYITANYLKTRWNRTVLNLVPGFFAIALLIVSVGMFYAVAKREGWAR